MKKKERDVLAGRSPEMQLLRAVRRWVESRGGSIVVIGGIEVQRWPNDPEGKYRIAVQFLGRKPDADDASRTLGEHVSPKGENE